MTQGDSNVATEPVAAYLINQLSPDLFNPYLKDNSCIQMAVDTFALNPNQDPGSIYKYVYRLKFCEIDRFSASAESLHQKCNKMLRWVEHEEAEPDSKKFLINSTLRSSKRKFLKFPFKYKYLKQDLVLEVACCLDNRPRGSKKKGDASFDSVNEIRNAETLLFKAAFSFEDFFRKQNKWVEPSQVMFSACEDSYGRVLAKEYLVTQKTLISFCLQIPLIPAGDTGKPENIFKSSRLMMHEIVDSDEWINPETAFKDDTNAKEAQKNDFVTENQRLEVVKITRCKMRAKDILEIEIGVKNLILRDTPFEERKFILRFLNKLDP
jgi:hypothetical protein